MYLPNASEGELGEPSSPGAGRVQALANPVRHNVFITQKKTTRKHPTRQAFTAPSIRMPPKIYSKIILFNAQEG